MWFVEKIGYEGLVSRRIEPQQCLRYNKSVAHKGKVYVGLKNTETKQTVDLMSWKLMDEFADVLHSYKPYGLVTGETLDDDGDIIVSDEIFLGGCLLVKVDEPSIKFLEYVERVEPVSPMDEKALAFIKGLKFHFTFWDTHGTLLEVGWTKGQFACSLFQILCFLTKGWYGDEFYLRQGICGTNGWVNIPARRVVFNNAHKARVMIAKAVATGYNPMRQYAEEIARMNHTFG